VLEISTKMYRYIIARWGYSRALEVGRRLTNSGYRRLRGGQSLGKRLDEKNGRFFQGQRSIPASDVCFQRDSLGFGHDVHQSENYGGTTPANWNSLVTKLWNGWTKPALTGESLLEQRSPKSLVLPRLGKSGFALHVAVQPRLDRRQVTELSTLYDVRFRHPFARLTNPPRRR